MPPVQKLWTVLAYIVADDADTKVAGGTASLDQFAQAEADAIRDALGAANAHVAVQIDFKVVPGVHRFINDKPVEIRQETGAGDPSVLVDFVDAVRAECPSQHVLALFWGHGGGPIGFFNDDNPHIPTAEKTLSLGGVRQALARFHPQRVDILLAKSCSMATLEACFELKEVARCLVASQGNVSEHPWEYQHIVEAMKKVKGTNCHQVAVDIVNALHQHYLKTATPDDDATPYGAMDLDRLSAVETMLRPLMNALRAAHDNDAKLWGMVRECIEDARPHQKPFEPSLIDVVAFCQHLARLPELASMALAVANAVQEQLVGICLPDSLFRGVSLFHFPNADDRIDSFANRVGPGQYGALRLSQEFPFWPTAAFANAPWALHK